WAVREAQDRPGLPGPPGLTSSTPSVRFRAGTRESAMVAVSPARVPGASPASPSSGTSSSAHCTPDPPPRSAHSPRPTEYRSSLVCSFAAATPCTGSSSAARATAGTPMARIPHPLPFVTTHILSAIARAGGIRHGAAGCSPERSGGSPGSGGGGGVRPGQGSPGASHGSGRPGGTRPGRWVASISPGRPGAAGPMGASVRLDRVDERIIAILGADARASFADIGAAVGLSASAAKRRVDRLVESGAIRGFTVVLEPASLGWTTEAYIEVYCRPRTSPAEIRAGLTGYA